MHRILIHTIASLAIAALASSVPPPAVQAAPDTDTLLVVYAERDLHDAPVLPTYSRVRRRPSTYARTGWCTARGNGPRKHCD